MLTPPLSPRFGPVLETGDSVMAPQVLDAAAPRGLRNSDSETCYINAPLQLVLNSVTLRAQVLRTHPHAGFEAFFEAYDSAGTAGSRGTDDTSLDTLQQHRDGVVAYLREHSRATSGETSTGGLIPDHGTAQSSEAMSFLLDTATLHDSPYVGLFRDDAEEARDVEGTIDEGYAIAVACKYIDGRRVFGAPALFGVAAISEMAQLVGSALLGFTYHEKGHYVAYVAKGDQWYRIDDSVPTPCDTETVKNLPLIVPIATTKDDPEPAVPMGEGMGVEVFVLA